LKKTEIENHPFSEVKNLLCYEKVTNKLTNLKNTIHTKTDFLKMYRINCPSATANCSAFSTNIKIKSPG
jgi:hypothetical protein